jgi:HEAT repeat protein
MIRLGKMLALSGKPEYAEKIRSLKESDEGDIAISALTALQMMGEDSMPEIIKLYETTRNPEVRERIVLSLSNLNNAKATDFLIRVAENDTSSAMREKAVNILGAWISHSGIFGTIMQRSISMSGPVPPVPPAPLVGTPKTTMTIPMPSSGIAAVQSPGFALTQTPEKNAEKREKILSALERIARKDRNESVRGQALFWIAQSAPNDSQIALLETVVKTDPSYTVREKALFALSQAPENRGIPGLIAVAKSDANVNLRTKAIHFLGMSKDPRARAALLEIAREVK